MISFESKITVKLLNYFLVNPTASHYINELARLLDLDPKNVDRKLKELEKEGLFKSEFKGKQRYYYLNADFPLLEQYRAIFNKTFGIENDLKNILKSIPEVANAWIYGSYARDRLEASSDIDLLVVGDHSTIELHRSLARYQKELGREINVVNMSEREFAAKKKERGGFIAGVMKGKTIKLI